MPLPHDPRYDGPLDDPRDLRSRSDARRERKQSEAQLMALAEQLVSLSERMLSKVQLPESLLEVVQRTRSIQSPQARNRALRALRIELRSLDAVELQRHVKTVLDPSHGGVGKLIETWRERLVARPAEELTAFLEQYPDADRRQLRQLLRNVEKAAEADKVESLRALTRVLREHVR